MSKDTGGPAFPAGAIRKTRQRPNDPGSDFVVSDMTEPRNAGMTLRDYFAAKAMNGGFACERWRNEFTFEQKADWSYQMADAMIAERAK